MSLPWNKSIELYVGVQYVCGTLRPAWYRQAALAQASHAVEQSVMAAEDAAPFSAIDAVLADLRTGEPDDAIDLHVILTDRYVHFDVVTGDYRDASDRQLRSIAAACVGELLGDLAAGQLVRWQLQPDQQHLLICSTALQTIASIEDAALRQSLSLASLQPAFCAQWNRHAIAAQCATTVFATADSAQVTVACVEGGTITAVSGGLFHHDEAWPQQGPHAAKELDSRVNWLVASIGADLSTVSRFILVARDFPVRRLGSRWTVVEAQQPEPQ